MSIKKTKKQIIFFWLQYEQKIILSIALVIVALISVEIGVLHGQKWQQKPLIIEKTSKSCYQEIKNDKKYLKNNKNVSENRLEKFNKNLIAKDCIFFGSIKSNKYHKKDCRWAGQIKKENIVCFKDKNDAKNKGYVPANCLK